MNYDETIEKTLSYIKDNCSEESTGHDYWHMYRVWKAAKHIAKGEEDVNMLVVELAALLHDVADWKFNDLKKDTGAKIVQEWLESLNIDEDTIEQIETIVRDLDFVGKNVESKLDTIEGKIVYDADKLDAIGAIGIARAFATGAKFKEVFHDPDISVPEYNNEKEYREAKGKSGRTVVNHFYEKLLIIKDLLFTETAKELALKRHEFMKRYLDEFFKEWEGLN